MLNSAACHKIVSKASILGALGIVFGDIGTSPLYAFKFCLGVVSNADISVILGILSLIFWSLMFVVTIKYVGLVMRANNEGEGGILALMSLVARTTPAAYRTGLLFVGLAGAAMFYGDSMITPAISVLSALEGTEVISPSMASWTEMLSIFVVIGLFTVQRFGTEWIGKYFGPTMLAWFVIIGVMGIHQIAYEPVVLKALNPWYALQFLIHHLLSILPMMAGVFLALTGAEALYADMGHFGHRPIAYAWMWIVFPSLALNYFGQGALVLRMGLDTIKNPFFEMSPLITLIPLVLLATAATVIASQAVISGAFSMSRAATQLSFLPRLHLVHTSSKEIGQVYLPTVNNLLMVAVIVLILLFKTSDNLAAAYGVAVASTMVLTTCLLGLVASFHWDWPKRVTLSLTVTLLTLDVLFVISNLVKVLQGGWFSLLSAAILITVMTTWRRGRQLVLAKLNAVAHDLKEFVPTLYSGDAAPHKIKGTAIFLSSVCGKTPNAFLHNLKHNQVVHDYNIFLSFIVDNVPYVPNSKRMTVTSLTHNCWNVVVTLGFKELPHVPRFMCMIRDLINNWNYEEQETSFFLSRESIVADRKVPGMSFWREKLYVLMSRNATKAADYFCLPRTQVIEIGSQVVI